jgi:hypothetical protein
MVAITVILAAVIGAFVLEIGDQQETAPSTSFDTEQQNRYFTAAFGGTKGNRNLTSVTVTHSGGETLSVSQNRLSVEGNTSVWQLEEPDLSSNCCPGAGAVTPVPNVWEVRGSNAPSEITSGEGLRFELYSSGTTVSHPDNGNDVDPFPGFEDTDPTEGNPYGYFIESDGYQGADNDPVIVGVYNGGGGGSGPWAGLPLEQGDTVRMIWTASSGGKTQTLFKYTVQ